MDPLANWFRKFLPPKVAYWLIRWRFALFYVFTYQFAKKAPTLMKRLLRRMAVNNLPEGYDIDAHFKPRYDPWDQRLCLILDADVYKTIADGRADVVTDQIDHFDATGIVLQSGRHIDADIVVTATGLQLQALGGITVSIDGEKINPHDRFVYKGYMLDDVPNLAWCIGYTNASWTLRADMNAEAVAKLLAFMISRLHARLPAPAGQGSAGEADLGFAGRLRDARARRAAEVEHPPALEHATQLPARLDRPPLRPHRGIDGVRPRGRRARTIRLVGLLVRLVFVVQRLF